MSLLRGNGHEEMRGALPLPLRVLRRGSHLLALHLFVRRATTREDAVRMFGLSLRVPPTVFHPRLYGTSRFLGEHLRGRDLRSADVLEIGCGSGLLAFLAAQGGARVTAIDINPRAVACTEDNARANGLDERVSVIESDLFERLPPGRTFDHIIWNPPFYRAEQSDHASRAWNAGISYEVISRFAASAGPYLRPSGTIILVTSSDAGQEEIYSLLGREGFTPAFRLQRRGLFETLSIVEFTRGGTS